MYDNYIAYLKEHLKEKRLIHSMNVADKCRYLAEKYDYDGEKAYFAGLLHDVCKNDSTEKQLQIFKDFGIMLDNIQYSQHKLWHSIAGAAVIENVFKINDREIIDAVRYHTTGRKDMTKLDKLLYLADFISDERDFDGVNSLREYSEKDLDTAVFACLKFSVNELCLKNQPIHRDTIDAYNQMAIEGKY